MNTLSKVVEWNKERGLDKRPSQRKNATRKLVEELLEYNGVTSEWMISISTFIILIFSKDPGDHEKIDALDDLIVIATGEILKSGYDPEKTMDETLKEISSRTGDINTATDKWEKFTTPEAKALWYTADYTECRLKENYD